jgi:hypothetical protein
LLNTLEELDRACCGPVLSAGRHRDALRKEAKPTTPRMSKAEALLLVDRCKKWLVAGSIVAFGVLAGLVAGHVIGSSSHAANQSNNQATPAPDSSSTSPSNNGGFFQQQGGNNFGNDISDNYPPPVPTPPDVWRVPSGLARSHFRAMGTTISLLVPHANLVGRYELRQ